jgi:hypothetical protein
VKAAVTPTQKSSSSEDSSSEDEEEQTKPMKKKPGDWTWRVELHSLSIELLACPHWHNSWFPSLELRDPKKQGVTSSECFM